MKHTACFYLSSILLILLGISNPAWAYIDPGAGSLFLQLLLGGVAGAIVVLKLYWHKFVGLFRKNSSQRSGDFPSDDQK